MVDIKVFFGKHAGYVRNALKAKNIEYFSNFRFLGYNAPTQFIGRKNEIIVNVNWKEHEIKD
jgi:hypothetical protein